MMKPVLKQLVLWFQELRERAYKGKAVEADPVVERQPQAQAPPLLLPQQPVPQSKPTDPNVESTESNIN